MNTSAKLLHIFKLIHGEPSTSCYHEVLRNDEGEPIGVALMKDGHECWSMSKLDLLFDYITQNM